MVDQVDINEWLIPESNNKQIGLEFKKIVPTQLLIHIILGRYGFTDQLIDYNYRKLNPVEISSSLVFQMIQIQEQT